MNTRETVSDQNIFTIGLIVDRPRNFCNGVGRDIPLFSSCMTVRNCNGLICCHHSALLTIAKGDNTFCRIDYVMPIYRPRCIEAGDSVPSCPILISIFRRLYSHICLDHWVLWTLNCLMGTPRSRLPNRISR